jgi:hypothetical protein
MQRRSESLTTHSSKEVVHRLLLLFNLPLHLSRKNNKTKWMLKVRDFAVRSNTANGRKRAE